MARGDASLRATTGEDGAYAIEGIAPGSYRPSITARKQGFTFSAKQAGTISLVDGQNEEGVDFQLEKGGVVRGLVRGFQGQALSGADIDVMPAGLLQNMFQDPGYFSDVGDFSTQTDTQGRFEILGFDFDKSYRLNARAEGHAARQIESFELLRETPEIELQITLSFGSIVSGTAVYEDGNPVPNHKIKLDPNTGDIMLGMLLGKRSTSTGADGAFTFEHVGEGEYRVLGNDFLKAVQGGDFNPLNMFGDALEIEVDGVNAITGLRVVVERGPETGSIQGIVLTSTGQPAFGVQVSAGPAGGGAFGMPGASATETTDEQGAFTLEELSGERFTVTAKGDQGAASVEGIALGDSLTLHLIPNATVSG
jgi:hypothetical protein